MSPYTVPAIVAVTVATVAIGAYGLRLARTTSDLLVASRTVSPAWNAAAISGEYLSVASYLGVAGLVLKHGVDALWYPVGFAAGYLALLLFVAGPLRRSGAFTLPDFCEARLHSRRLRKLATDRYSPPIAAAFQPGLTTRDATRKSDVVRASRSPYAPIATVASVTATIAGTMNGLLIARDAAPARRSPARCAPSAARTPSPPRAGTGTRRRPATATAGARRTRSPG